MSAEPSAFTKIKDLLWGGIKAGTTEIMTLIPDSILFGSLLMYIMTSNMSYGIFGIFIFEMMLSHKLISWVISQTTGESRPYPNEKCLSGFKTPRFDPSKILPIHGYPPFSIFSISSIATYIGLAMASFKSVLATMGPEWQSRSTVSMVLLSLVTLLFVIIRYMSGCDSIGDMMISIVSGIVVGLIFFGINNTLFGQESMNFLGVPSLVNKSEIGAPIYVCSTNSDSNVHYS